MQAVPLGASAANAEGGHCPSAYEWSEQLSDGTLLAVGGGAPSTVHLWNLQQELCMEQVSWTYSKEANPLCLCEPYLMQQATLDVGPLSHICFCSRVSCVCAMR